MKHYDDGQARFYAGDVRVVLRELPANSVHCVVTSPPYWGLRDYGTPGQLGLEATPEEYVATMVDVFREVRRVLRDDGTLWLNIGDSYGGTDVTGRNDFETLPRPRGGHNKEQGKRSTRYKPHGLKPKDLVGIPWMLAFALRADGWWLRQDIIWNKPNPMPESVTDRCTKAHEYVFLLSKSARYYYDADAVREAAEYGRREWSNGREQYDVLGASRESTTVSGSDPSAGRNKRSVWAIATEAYSEAHFATFPQALVKPCILAGTSEHGVCSECGAPWARVTERVYEPTDRLSAPNKGRLGAFGERAANMTRDGFVPNRDPVIITTGWAPTCKHEAPVVPATVLDPFLGSGTTAMVAKALGRHAIGIDLNPTYLAMAAKRCAQMGLM